ncbi:MAG: lasso peptide biosynthesis B2 protein, partial [Burkholderiales bacterium]
AFIGYASASDRSRATEAMLIERNILVPEEKGCREDAPAQVSIPLRSAHEMPMCHTNYAVLALPEVMVTTWRCRRRIWSWPLRDVINETERYRAHHCPPPATPPGRLDEQRLLQTVSLFLRARLYAPIETRCLLDSISLTRFLARRHLHSRIVLGVTNDPFSAHCWCQAGDIVLNDTVGNATAHTIIKVI